MRLKYGSVLAAALVMLVPPVVDAQDAAKAVAGGGISAKGWTGKIDANEEKAGQTLNNAKLVQEGNALKATTGPAVAYWNPANKAAGNYTVKATFTEEKFMGLNDHAHPYGIVIAGNDLGTPQQSYLYCAAYGTGNFIVRGFGPEGFRVNGRRARRIPRSRKRKAPESPSRRKLPSRSKGTRSSARSTAPSSAATTRPRW